MHRIKTGYGVSYPDYDNEEYPLACLGQDDGLGPVLWCLISSIIIKICKDKGHGMTTISSISKMETSLIRFTFVNNTDLVSGSDDVDTTSDEFIPKFQSFML